jgi:isoleucyl-tRNA synthetase
MSKSVGNVVDPRSVILGGKDQKKDPPYGADVLRLWVASVDYTSDVMIGGRIIGQVADVYRKLRFTLRFLLGNLADYDPATHAVPHAELAAADRYILARFAALVEECSQAYAAYQFYRVYQALQRFVVLDLSNFYLDVAKDRLYISAPGSPRRRACQTVLDALLRGLLPLVAPLVPHMAEDAWQNLPYPAPTQSVFQAGWAAAPTEWVGGGEEAWAAWRALLGVRAEVNQQMEKARADKALGASLEARVLVHAADAGVAAALRALQATDNGQDELRYLLIASAVDVVGSAAEAAAAPYTSSVVLEGGGEVTVGVMRAAGRKCGRCWNYSERVGEDPDHPEACERCAPVVRGLGVPAQPAKLAPAM